MAGKSFDNFKSSDLYSMANIGALQEHLANYYNRSDAGIRSDAKAQLEPTYDASRLALQNQLSELDTKRTLEIKGLNKQYDRTGNEIQRDLNSKGLGRSSLVSTRGVENENTRNSAIASKSLDYLSQQNEINANIQKLDSEYAQNVENKYSELRQQQIADRLSLMSNIANIQLQAYGLYLQQ